MNLIAAMLAVVLLASACSAGDPPAHPPSNSANPAQTTTSPPPPKRSGVDSGPGGTKAKFTVKSVKCGLATLPAVPEFGAPAARAQGAFCVVRGTARNTGKDPVRLYGWDAAGNRLYDTQQREFAPDDQATMTAAWAAFGMNIPGMHPGLNPGASGEWLQVFDVPKDAKPATIRVHADDNTPGVLLDAS